MGRFTDRLAQTARRAREAEEAQFPRDEMCHDCAFRPDSPERKDPEVWARLLADPDQSGLDGVFYCHHSRDGSREMPTDEHGNYNPRRDASGRPVGWPICAGWVRTFDVNMDRLNRRRKQ